MVNKDFVLLGAARLAPPDSFSNVLLVGEDNPYGALPEYALYPLPSGCSGNRLCNDIMGLRHSTYLGLWRINLCDGKWATKSARTRAEMLHQTMLGPWRTTIMFGRKVAEAFGKITGKTLKPFEVTKHTVYFSEYANAVRTYISLPHPSGRNLVWNQETVRANARMILAREVPDVPWGEAL